MQREEIVAAAVMVMVVLAAVGSELWHSGRENSSGAYPPSIQEHEVEREDVAAAGEATHCAGPLAPSDEEVWVRAYCPCEECCGKWAQVPAERRRTASGHLLKGLVERGVRFVASAEVPLGTLVEIEGYGTVVVLDRSQGGLEVFFETHEEAVAWGKRKCRVRWFREEESGGSGGGGGGGNNEGEKR